MPSARRMRLLVLAAVVATAVIFYVTNGAEQTRSSPFYQKTVAFMEKQGSSAMREEIPPKGTFFDDDGDGDDDSELIKVTYEDAKEAPPEEPVDDMTLRERLRHAELEAKKNADDKWRDMHGEPEPEWVAAAAKAAEDGEDDDDAIGAATDAPYGIQGGGKEDGVPHIGNVAQQVIADDDNSDSGAGPGQSFGTPKDPEAERELNALMKRSPVLIFSKTTCPYSAKAKRILTQAYTITPPPHVVELDQHAMGSRLQELLSRTTGRSTVPNILITGVSVGGGDDVEQLWKDGRVEEVIRSYAGKKLQSVERKHAYGEEF